MKKILLLLIIAISFTQADEFAKAMRNWNDAIINYNDVTDAILVGYIKPEFRKLMRYREKMANTQASDKKFLKALNKHDGTTIWEFEVQIPISNCESVLIVAVFLSSINDITERTLTINDQPLKIKTDEKLHKSPIKGDIIKSIWLPVETQIGRNFVLHELLTKDNLVFAYNETETKITTKGFNNAFVKAKKMCKKRANNRKNAK